MKAIIITAKKYLPDVELIKFDGDQKTELRFGQNSVENIIILWWLFINIMNAWLYYNRHPRQNHTFNPINEIRSIPNQIVESFPVTVTNDDKRGRIDDISI